MCCIHVGSEADREYEEVVEEYDEEVLTDGVPKASPASLVT